MHFIFILQQVEEMPERRMTGFVEAYSDHPNLTITITNKDGEDFDKELSMDILRNLGLVVSNFSFYKYQLYYLVSNIYLQMSSVSLILTIYSQMTSMF